MRSRTIVLFSGLAAALFCGASEAQSTNGTAAKTMTLQMPATPDPARVTLDPKTTALIVLDYVEDICAIQPSCKNQMLPAMVPFMERIRKAGLVIAYGTREQNMTHWLKEVAPQAGDYKVINTAQDRFFRTDLDKIPKEKGIKTLILVGWKISGSILYTSVGATLRGYTVVVPVDASLAPNDHEAAIGPYMILNQSAANPQNEALKPKAAAASSRRAARRPRKSFA